jgi:hypothetical protein
VKFDDGKPWFRRWLWIGFLPISDEGRLISGGAAGTCLLAGFAALYLDGRSPWTEVLFGIAFLVTIPALVIVYWKMEDQF